MCEGIEKGEANLEIKGGLEGTKERKYEELYGKG